MKVWGTIDYEGLLDDGEYDVFVVCFGVWRLWKILFGKSYHGGAPVQMGREGDNDHPEGKLGNLQK